MPAKKIDVGNYPVNIGFNLRSKLPANKETAINAIVRFNNQRIVISKIDKIEPRFWNIDKQEPKKQAANVRASEVLSRLTKAKAVLIELFNNYVQSHGSFPDDLKAFQLDCQRVLFNRQQVSHEPKKITFIDYIKTSIKDIEAGKKLIKSGKHKGKALSQNSKKDYTNLLFNLNLFIEHSGRETINFSDIDLDFYNDFREFVVVGRDRSPGYFGSLVKSIKAVMNDALDNDLHTNLKHQKKSFIKETTEADTIFLDSDQLTKLLNMDLSGKPHLDNARNLFLLGAYSGLRFSDFINIKEENIQGDYLRIRAQKTGDYLKIPISKEMRIVLGRYMHAGHTITNQKLNDYIKDVCEIAELTTPVSVKSYKNGQEVYTSRPLYELVTTHTARRSWATNAFKAGYPTLMIRAITGHKTESAFLKYIRLSNEEIADMMLVHMRRNELKVVGGGLE